MNDQEWIDWINTVGALKMGKLLSKELKKYDNIKDSSSDNL